MPLEDNLQTGGHRFDPYIAHQSQIVLKHFSYFLSIFQKNTINGPSNKVFIAVFEYYKLNKI